MLTLQPYDNPFTPSFGEVPAFMAGRGEVISSIVRALEGARRSPYLTCAISGARGTGKTSILTLAGDEAERRGWMSVDVTSLPGMLESIYELACDASAHLLPQGGGARPTSVSIAGVGASWEYPAVEGRGWRSRMAALLDMLAEHDAGLLITVDEVRPDCDELVQLVAAYQHFVRERRRVGLLLAGLPRSMSQLISSESVSFLRRAQRVTLGNIADFEARRTFEKTIELGGRSASGEALDVMVSAAAGYPFMIQLVGYRVWDASEGSAQVSPDHAREGCELARLEFAERILGPTYRELSSGDRRFLAAMLDDEGASELGEIARRLDRGNSYAAQYKRRLLDQGVIDENFEGLLRFAMPGMREFVASLAK